MEKRILFFYIISVFFYHCASAPKGIKQELNEVKQAESVRSGLIIDDFDTLAGWETYADQGTIVKLSSVKGKKGKALNVDYEMGPGKWLGVWKQLKIDLSKYKGIRFVYKGTGKKNTLEFKLEDMDRSYFGKLFISQTAVEEWKEVIIDFNDLEYWWSGDKNLNLNKVKIHFAVSVKNSTDQAGSGSLIIDEITAIK